MLCGLLGALWMLGMVILGGATFPGYSHVSQYISELGANGAPHGELVSYAGFFPAGVLICAFAFFAWLAAPRSALSTIGFFGIFQFSIGYVAATFFRCDFGCRPEEPSYSQQMHNTLGVLGYLFSPMFLLLLALAARKWANAQLVSSLGFVAALLSLIGLMTIAPDAPFAGLSQRLIEASVLTWVVACGVYLGRQPRPL